MWEWFCRWGRGGVLARFVKRGAISEMYMTHRELDREKDWHM